MRYEYWKKHTVRRDINHVYALEAVIDMYKDTHNLELVYTLEVLGVNKLTMKCTDIGNMNGSDWDGVRCPPMYLTEARLGEYLFEFAMIDPPKAYNLLANDEREGEWAREYYGNIRPEPVLSIDVLGIDDSGERLSLVIYPSTRAQDDAEDQFREDRVMAVVSTSVNEIFEMSPAEFREEQERLRKLAKLWGNELHEAVDITDYFTASDIQADEEADEEDDEMPDFTIGDQDEADLGDEE